MEKKAVNRTLPSKTNQIHLKTQNPTLQPAQGLKGKMNQKSTMKLVRESKGAPPTDLLVCFPSPAHLSLTSKPLCSPARATESRTRHHHHSTRSNLSRNSVQASPYLWDKTNLLGSDPTSPKVSCAGQIKVRAKPKPKPSSSKDWQSLMEEIEMLHNNTKHKKKGKALETCGSHKKDLRQYFSCFSSVHGSDFASIVVQDGQGKQHDKEYLQNYEAGGVSKNIFSKWFMVLQEHKNDGLFSRKLDSQHGFHEEKELKTSVPPANALLLMHGMSTTPAKRLKERIAQEEEEEAANKVTWNIISGMKDPFSTSRRWTRF